MMIRLVRLLVPLLLCPIPALATVPAFQPEIGHQIDVRTPLTDRTGAAVTLDKVMDGRPALVLFGYNNCPNLCGVAQGAAAAALLETGLDPDGYRALFVTVDPLETAADADEGWKKLAAAAGPEAAAPWRFLVGSGISRLAGDFGPETLERDRLDQFVHPVGLVLLSPEGRITRVLPGLNHTPRDLRLALVEASQGKLGSFADQAFLFCAGYDEDAGQYSSVVTAGLRAGGAVTLAGLAALVLVLLRRERR